MLVLYEHSTSVCVIKVRLTLLEKGIPYEGRFIDLRRGGQFDRDYVRIHPGAVVPALLYEGKSILESSVIQYFLEDLHPDPAMMPDDLLWRHRVRWLMKFIDDSIHPAAGPLTQGIAFRKDYPTSDAIEARLAQLVDPRRRDRQRSVFTEAVDSPFIVDAVRNFDRLVTEMELTLATGPWLGGNLYSLADAAATPYINRLDMLGLLDLFTGHRPHVSDWFDRVRARPSFDQGITNWYTDDDADRFAPYAQDGSDRTKIKALLDEAPANRTVSPI